MDCPASQRDTITTRLHARLEGRGRSEFKWSANPSRDLDGFVDEIFDLIKNNGLWFRCVVVKQSHVDHKTFSHGDKDLSLEKFIFTHLIRFARWQSELRTLTRFYVELDNRTPKYTGAGLKKSLNRRFTNETGHKWEIFADVTDVDSKSRIMVQAADVLAGCVAWVWNKQYKNEKVDPDRVKLAERIALRADLRAPPSAQNHRIGREDFRIFGYPTVRFMESEQRFAIWRLNLRKDQEDAVQKQRAEIAAQYPKRTTFNQLREDYHIGTFCFACDHEQDVLPAVGFRPITSDHRPVCTLCGDKAYLTFTKRRVD